MRMIPLALTLLGAPVAAEECAPFSVMESELRTKHGEMQVGIGIENAGRIASLFVNEETGTWTVVYSSRDGSKACVVGHGKGWARLEPHEPIKGDDA